MGIPVVIDRSQLNESEQAKYDKGWKDNSFNQYASDMISVRRSLPDVRDAECNLVKWDHRPLPSVSVVIIFHNEALSVLLRTVYSVLDQSDAALLKEIILVDDFSDFSI